MDWFRWHHGTSKDPKWRVVSKKSGVQLGLVVAVWATLAENASESTERGTLQGWNAEDVAAGLDMTVEQVEAVYDAMQGKVRDGKILTGWHKRNPKRERDDNSTERVQRFRDIHKNETPRNATKRPDRKKEREIERKNSNIKKSSSPVDTDAPVGAREPGSESGETQSKSEAAKPEAPDCYGEFGHVRLTSDQASRLRSLMGKHFEAMVAEYDDWVHTAPNAKHNGVRRVDRDAYASLRAWFRRKTEQGVISNGTHQQNSGDGGKETPGSTSERRTKSGDPVYVPKQ